MMSKRNELLESIANTICDYREGEIEQPSPKHVDRWIKQFNPSAQEPLLMELDYVFKRTYFSKDVFREFLSSCLTNAAFTGPSHLDFWAHANFLNIQQHGHSQTEILELFSEELFNKCGLNVKECGQEEGLTSSTKTFIYLDDILFGGMRVGNDLCAWIEDEAPAIGHVHVVVMAAHLLGEFLCQKRLDQVAIDANKKITFQFWASKRLENRRAHRNMSQVLWPAVIPQNTALKTYIDSEKKFPFELRMPGCKLKDDIFSSEAGRQLLETEFLLAGVRIRSMSKNPKDKLRPLGFSPFGLGFGSMLATFRNCPNNSPLALWWGDPEAVSGALAWYPLLPRKTYAMNPDNNDISF